MKRYLSFDIFIAALFCCIMQYGCGDNQESDSTAEIVGKTVVESSFEFSDDGSFLTLSQDDQPVLRYVYGMHLEEGVPEDRRRSCYIHPLYGLDGEILTDDFPEDHYHHRGVFLTWPLVIADGDSLDLWTIYGVEKRFERFIETETGPDYAKFGVQCGWHTEKSKIVEELFRVTVYNANENGRAIDCEVELRALDSMVTLVGSTTLRGYGGFSIRPAPFTEPVITNVDGVQKDSDLVRSPWADFSAKFGGRDVVSGFAIFEDERNLNTPNGWCLRHYGFLGIEWPGNNPYRLRPERPFTGRYRIYLHRGDVEQGKVHSAYTAYTNRNK